MRIILRTVHSNLHQFYQICGIPAIPCSFFFFFLVQFFILYKHSQGHTICSPVEEIKEKKKKEKKIKLKKKNKKKKIKKKKEKI